MEPVKDARGLHVALLVIATAQLVLDDSIANIALPTLQNELGIPTADLP